MLIFGGRFQPFHIGHLAVYRKLTERFSEKIVIGVVAPDPDRHFPGDEKNWGRFSRDKNPLSYWERQELIYISLGEHNQRLGAVVPLPRPSVNFERANNYLPQKPRTFVLCAKWGDEVEQWKAEAYKSHGEQLHFIEFTLLDPLAQLASGELIRCLMRLDNSTWKIFVASPAVSFFESESIRRKMTAHLTVDKAKEFLTNFFANERLGASLQRIVEPNPAAQNPSPAGTPHLSLESGLSLLNRLESIVGKAQYAQVNIEQHIYMKDNYSARQVVGAMGPNASIRDVNVHQVAQDLKADNNTERLLIELERIRLALKQKLPADSHDITIGAITAAKQSATDGDWTGTVENLRRAGSFALDVAKEIGTTVAAEALKKALGL